MNIVQIIISIAEKNPTLMQDLITGLLQLLVSQIQAEIAKQSTTK